MDKRVFLVAVEPGRLIVTCGGVVSTVKHMTRRERYDFVAFTREGFEFGREIGRSRSFRTPSLVKSGNADRITGSDDPRRRHGFVQQDKSKHSIEEPREIFIMFLVLVGHGYKPRDEQRA